MTLLERTDRVEETDLHADVLVIGNGMVGHHLVERLVEAGHHHDHSIVVAGEERHRAYDRVHLSRLFSSDDPSSLFLGDDDLHARSGIELVLGDPVARLETTERVARTESGRTITYSTCVLATGSSPFVPPIPGTDAAGVFVYRTLDDLEAIRNWADRSPGRGVVVGGGLLGLEAAGALAALGLDTTVVEFAPHLMAAQIDEGGGRALQRHVEALGVKVRTGTAVTEVLVDDGVAFGLRFAESPELAADLVVFAAGIRPRDQLGRDAGLDIGPRGGVVVDDTCQTSAPGVLAIGEVASHRDRVYGLVAPGYQMAQVVADRLTGGAGAFEGADTSTRLKLLGAAVASVGEPRAEGDEVVVADPVAGLWQKVVLDASGRVLGAVLVGDDAPFGALVQAYRSATPVPDVLALLRPTESMPRSTADLPDDAPVCSCQNVTCGPIRAAVTNGVSDLAEVKRCTGAGTGCGSCVPVIQEVVDAQLEAGGSTVRRRLCAHFSQSRPELYELIRATGIRSFAELVDRHGTGSGCEVCKPVVASILASLEPGYILDGEQASLQDSNDHFLANIQRDGTYSVVPRVPGGEITPDQLVAIGEVARDFDLYTKITGGQRIDLFGATVDQLPAIWSRLRDAGLESGHAYGKAVRTVKSCVGSTWCRYGVQDSVQMAIDLELRYRGLRAPHKLKFAVSGCARECAEARSKDVGVIATERGWNLYVGGNGGMRPAHAELLAEDLDDESLVRAIDRYVLWYVRSAERLQRTAAWQRQLPGGIDFVRRVVLDDALGIGAELDAEMLRHVEGYRCEWSATLDDPARLARFTTFVNSDTNAPTVTRVEVRGQRVPA
jgi:nitrite reductase (NADH) large subunit